MKKAMWFTLIVLLCVFLFSGCDRGVISPNNNNIPSTQQLPDNTEPDNTELDDTEPDDTDVRCEHTWGEWLAVKQANCKEEGMLVRTCSKCSETEESILAKNDMHNEVVDVAISATCTENGKTEGKHCSICNMIIVQQEIVPLVDHIYDNNYDNACNVCGYTRDVECAHSETETIQGKDATCTETGLTNGIRCKKCGEIIVEQTVLELKKHTEVIDKGISATCTIAGLTEGLHCSVCNMVLIAQQTINPSHVFLESYEFNGECHWKKCSVCNAIEGEGSHTLNSKGNCDICGSLILATAGVLYDISSDGKSAEVIGYSGTATKVKIANEYNGLPVQTIYKEAFKDNKDVTLIIVPDSVLYVRDSAFYNCTALSSVIIGDNVALIEDKAFYNCCSLENVEFGKNLKEIGQRSFANCTKLTKLIFGENLVEIEGHAFSGCLKLTDIIFKDKIEVIGDYAFSGCTELLNVSIPNTIKEIGSQSFASSSKILNEYTNCLYIATTTNPYFALVETTNKNFSTYTMHEDCKVIATSAFVGCSRLSNINIQRGVVSIGEKAFYDCSNLTDIVIPDSVNYIGDDAFKGCIIANATLPAFATTRLTAWIENVTITSGTTIPGAFNGCSNLKTVVLADTVTTLVSNSFQDCQRLQEIVLPESITEIHNKVFKRCFELTYINIPDKVKCINAETFASCRKLKSILIGSGVESIYFDAFTGCESLEIVYYKGSAAEWDEISITYSGNSKLISATRYYYSEQQPTEEGLFWHYDEKGEIVIWN